VRTRIRGFIEELLEAELDAALGRERYERARKGGGHSSTGAIGARHGHRQRGLLGTFADEWLLQHRRRRHMRGQSLRPDGADPPHAAWLVLHLPDDVSPDSPGVRDLHRAGQHTRAGIEDNLWDTTKGVRMNTIQMIERHVRMATELGRAIATPEQAHQMLKIGVTYKSTEETLANLGLPRLVALLHGGFEWRVGASMRYGSGDADEFGLRELTHSVERFDRDCNLGRTSGVVA
jgi:hypothetical protein